MLPSRWRTCVFVLVLLIVTGHHRAYSQGKQVVSLELVLLVDVSASVNDGEFRLQAIGLANALKSPAVTNAIEALTTGGLAICLVQWADETHQVKSVDWTVLHDQTEALELADRIGSMKRQIDGGHTALGDALAFALNELDTNQFSGLRRVIDLSGDGRTNDGRSLYGTRKEVLKHGVTINGLAILNELPLLADYFRKQLIGGDGSFVETAQDYSDFETAITRKLEREIRSAPLAGNMIPGAIVEAQARALLGTRSHSTH